MIAIASHTLRANGIRQNFIDAGAGAPVVLLHGFPETNYAWRMNTAKLLGGPEIDHYHQAIAVVVADKFLDRLPDVSRFVRVSRCGANSSTQVCLRRFPPSVAIARAAKRVRRSAGHGGPAAAAPGECAGLLWAVGVAGLRS